MFDVYYLRIEIIFDNCYQSLLSTYFFNDFWQKVKQKIGEIIDRLLAGSEF